MKRSHHQHNIRYHKIRSLHILPTHTEHLDHQVHRSILLCPVYHDTVDTVDLWVLGVMEEWVVHKDGGGVEHLEECNETVRSNIW
ncbi:hypothetical protein CAEBREN_17761 [Caenorhabditis brenneri]|uniref:Uncharacterized protein n=1 Tax=Caenorhabditis brenneri TaxID=135651 RepID=G0N359_CAEBE|nr:hypothetical protein CAEBREN_17761 [Caenorhabditis brenneri]